MFKRPLNAVGLFALLAAVLTFTSCSKDEDPVPVFGVAFEKTALGIGSNASEVTVKVSFTQATTVENKIVIGVTETATTYGADYTTDPAVANGKINLTIPAGASSATFKVTRKAKLLDAGKKVAFKLESVNGEKKPSITGNTIVTVSFDAVASSGSSMTPNVGGPTEPNQVFIDLSLDKATVVKRTSWDLGFSSGSANRVILNYSTYGMVKALNKTDLKDVTSADTTGFAADVRIGKAGADKFMDHPDGDLTKTAIAEISATAGENKVYILNRGAGPGTGAVKPGSVNVGSTPLGWKKIRIIKKGNDYVLQHADINSSTFSEVTISKQSGQNFTYFSFNTNKVVNVEPGANKWDIVFSVSSNIINFGRGSGAYGFSDFIKSNRLGNTRVIKVVLKRDKDKKIVPGQITYDAFKKENVKEADFKDAANTIGSSWRSVFSKTAHQYVYYIVKDAEGNYYKLQFLSLMNKKGERGNPSFKYARL